VVQLEARTIEGHHTALADGGRLDLATVAAEIVGEEFGVPCDRLILYADLYAPIPISA
jgi:hypothetical protein